MTPGQFICQTRRRHGLTQAQLALRAGTTQAAISRLERDERSPTVETLDRLLLSMGERVELAAHRIEGRYDPVHLEHELSLSPAERLDHAFHWMAFNDRLLGAAGSKEEA